MGSIIALGYDDAVEGVKLATTVFYIDQGKAWSTRMTPDHSIVDEEEERKRLAQPLR